MVQQDHLAKGGTVEEPEAFYLLELSCQVGGVCATHGGVQVHHLADRTLPLPPLEACSWGTWCQCATSITCCVLSYLSWDTAVS